jgi:hypothetical protein
MSEEEKGGTEVFSEDRLRQNKVYPTTSFVISKYVVYVCRRMENNLLKAPTMFLLKEKN